jgi:hypothetical protein
MVCIDFGVGLQPKAGKNCKKLFTHLVQNTKTKKRISDISEEFLTWLQMERRFGKFMKSNKNR